MDSGSLIACVCLCASTLFVCICVYILKLIFCCKNIKGQGRYLPISCLIHRLCIEGVNEEVTSSHSVCLVQMSVEPVVHIDTLSK